MNESPVAIKLKEMETKIQSLEANIRSYQEKFQSLSKLYNEDQLQKLSGEKVPEWSAQSIMKGLKYRFGLSVRGYEFITSQGHPYPGYSTLNRRLLSYKVTNGVFTDLREPLSKKVECLRSVDRCCSLLVDEMELQPSVDFDKNEKRFYGYKTIGTEKARKELGNHIVAVMIRGLAAQWKQVIAYEITGSKTRACDLKKLIDDSIKFAESCGLYVVSMTSDMGSQNRKMWTREGVMVQREGSRKNFFYSNGHRVYVVPDPPHLLKNLKSAMLKKIPLKISDEVKNTYNLPCNEITGQWVQNLWDKETKADEETKGSKEVRLLHHLNREDLWPDNWQKMDVGPAVRFFSLKTAAALEEGIERGLLHENCRSTVWFIRKIESWYTLLSSRLRKMSITKTNKNEKVLLLEEMIGLFELMEVNGSAWKPLNAGMILASLSLLDICDYLLDNGYDFVLLSRFSQDALENVFSQVRRKCGMTPTVLNCRRALKLITLSQFSSDIKHTNYASDSDLFLIEFFSKKGKLNDSSIDMNGAAVPFFVVSKCSNADEGILDFAEPFPTIEEFENYSNIDAELVCHIAGSATNAVLKKVICDECRSFLNDNTTPKYTRYVRRLSKGGLKLPNSTVLTFVLNIEIIYQKYRSYILHNGGHESLIQKIVQDMELEFPTCPCNVKYQVAKHFFVVRSYTVRNFHPNTKKRKIMRGTSTAKKRKV